MDVLDILVGERLSVSRRRRGLSQADFGSMIGRSESWVSKVETGAMRLDSVALARKIAGLLGVDVRFLLGLDSGGAPTGATTGAREVEIRHVLVGAGDWEVLDPLRRRWFFVQAGAATLEVLAALGPGRGDLPERASAAQDGRARVDAETVDGLSEIVLTLRTAYRSVSGYSLLGPAYGILNLVTELAPDAGRERARMVALAGQLGTLLASVFALDLEDFEAARPYLRLAMRAAQESSDAELMAFTLGGRAFHAAHGGDLGSGAAFADAALDSARAGIHPQTHAWLLAVASEMHASTGSGARCEQLLERAAGQLELPDVGRAWVGIGAFNPAKLAAYRGGDMMRLGRHREAQEVLGAALAGLGPALSKHRCTAHIDLAGALARDGRLDDAADHAVIALEIIGQTRHAGSLRRVEELHREIAQSGAAAGRRVGERLLYLKALS
jgi:transcriptional regulator with XRE-family HTH domain/tetratricopeptide (TPR) repeat protein